MSDGSSHLLALLAHHMDKVELRGYPETVLGKRVDLLDS
jgi:hypothetical protein